MAGVVSYERPDVVGVRSFVDDSQTMSRANVFGQLFRARQLRQQRHARVTRAGRAPLRSRTHTHAFRFIARETSARRLPGEPAIYLGALIIALRSQLHAVVSTRAPLTRPEKISPLLISIIAVKVTRRKHARVSHVAPR